MKNLILSIFLFGVTFNLYSQNPSPLEVSPKSLNFEGEFVYRKDNNNQPVVCFICTNNSGYNLSNVSFTFFRESFFDNKVETIKCPFIWNSNVYMLYGNWYRYNTDYSIYVVPDNYKWEKGDKVTLQYDGMNCKSWHCDKEINNEVLSWLKKNWTYIQYIDGDDLKKIGKYLKRIR